MNTIYCNNCGNIGHLYRQCRYPVLSYGIICINSKKEILMIQRKDSICYIEFLRGKYQLNNSEYIINLLNRCSVDERRMIELNDFDVLWNKLWFSGKEKKEQTERMIKEYNKSKQYFEKLKNTNLNYLLSKCNKKYEGPEWEFPKGRRSTKETNLNCAIREFEEETDIKSNEYILIENVKPISEEYIGSNGVRYKHTYYYSLYKGDRELTINSDKYEQYSEIGNIKWFSYEECLDKIRNEYITKKEIIEKVNNFIKQWENEFTLKE